MPRLNVEFSDEINAALEELAARQDTTKAEVLRRSIALGKWLQDTKDEKSRILVERPDGQVREILPL
jgi:predicted transcriptional regulator